MYSLPVFQNNDPDVPIHTKTGAHRCKHSIRAIFRIIALISLIAVYGVSNHFYGQSESLSSNQSLFDKGGNVASWKLSNVLRGRETQDLNQKSHRALKNAFDDNSEDNDDGNKNGIFQKKADPKWLMVFYVIGVIYMFLALAIVCDDFFVPALEEMSCSRHMNLSMDVSGATLMAAGGSAPELFTSFIGTFMESDVGFGTIVGSAVFNVLFVVGMCSLLSKEVLSLTWWPLFRDSTFYSIGLIVLAMFVGVISEKEIEKWEAGVLFAMYFVYVGIMYFNESLYKAITGKDLVQPKVGESDDDDDDDTSTDFRYPTTFRASVLKLLRDPESWVTTAGVGIVARMAGDVDELFKETDTDGNGLLDMTELGRLFEKLEYNISEAELAQVMKELDTTNDGRIDEKEFTCWYVSSKDRISSNLRPIFEKFDTNNSGSIEREELKLLLEKIDPRVTESDIDAALQACHQSGSENEISFDEFTDWYMSSMCYEKSVENVGDHYDGFCAILAPPKGGSCKDILLWAFLLPLVLPLTLTIPDVRKPGLGRWCYLSFFLAIMWIGGFSFLMVGWAECIGETLGIPSYIMGLTFLAAGTSVPDLLSSVIVARRGLGDMAISSSIGSNIFDILVGLPLPWLSYCIYPDKPSTVQIGADGLWLSIFILLGMIVLIITVIHFQGWKLTKKLGYTMFCFYFLFLTQALLREYV